MVCARSGALRLENGTRYGLVFRVVGSHSESTCLKATS